MGERVVTEEPRPPEGVVIWYRDGESVPAEVYYVGVAQGTHHWQVTTAIDLERLDHIHVDLIPARTTVSFPTAT
jgi:hypothetical protein